MGGGEEIIIIKKEAEVMFSGEIGWAGVALRSDTVSAAAVDHHRLSEEERGGGGRGGGEKGRSSGFSLCKSRGGCQRVAGVLHAAHGHCATAAAALEGEISHYLVRSVHIRLVSSA